MVGSNLCEHKRKSFHPIYICNKVLLIDHVYNYHDRHEHIVARRTTSTYGYEIFHMQRKYNEEEDKKKVELLMKVLGKVLCK